MGADNYIVSDITGLEDIKEMETCKMVAEVLNESYPDHLWAVSWQGGAIVVKNLAISGHYGMILDGAERYSASAIRKDAIMKAGELLERCGMKRGRWDGQGAQRLEGSDPEHFKPWKN